MTPQRLLACDELAQKQQLQDLRMLAVAIHDPKKLWDKKEPD